jgi:hypothetical protein
VRYVVLDARQVGERGAWAVTTDVWRAIGALTERGAWPLGGARAWFCNDTRRVLLEGPRADELLRDELLSELLELR